jgi:hypothetical protein
MKKNSLFSVCCIISSYLTTGCRLGTSTGSDLLAPVRKDPQSYGSISQEIQQEDRFRSIFNAHLKAAGKSEQAINDAMFLTPETLKEELSNIPKNLNNNNFISAIDQIYSRQDPTQWYLAGKAHLPQDPPIAGRSPITFIILPGFSSEFINADPFEEILNDSNSKFARTALPVLEKIDDYVFSIKDLKQNPVKLSEVVRVGSKDDSRGNSMVNLIMLSPRIGSLESIGTLESTVQIYQRRLNHIFSKVGGLGTVYLLGYSRGAIVGLELLRATDLMHRRDGKSFPWIDRIHGLVSLGGVLYGSELADHAFKDQASVQSKMRQSLQNLVSELKEGPSNLCSTLFNPEFRSIAAHNINVYTNAIRAMMTTSYEPTRGKIGLLIAEEKLRHMSYGRTYPGIFANFDQVQKLLFEIINIKSPVACYSDNVKAFKKIVSSVIEGANTLTTDARLKWWQSAQLNKKFRILSLSGTMPGPVNNQKLSPIISLPYYGYQSPDFIFVQRPSYYVMLENGASNLNDSAVTAHRSRYWPQLDPVQGRSYDQLGILGSHHFGIAFHMAISDCKGTPNFFPRTEMVSALASYLRQYPRQLSD